MKTFALHGHTTRGKEVIEILEMLGGINKATLKGNSLAIYYIGNNNHIDLSSILQDRFIDFYLEDFLEKYPYKVGDKVLLNNQVKVVKGVKWDCKNNEVLYTLETNINGVKTEYQVFNYDLQPYKEAVYTDYVIDGNSKPDITIDGEKLIVPKGYIVKNATTNGNSLIVEYVKNKPQYPKTYVECCEIIKKVAKTTHELDIAYNPHLIYNFQKLLVCRDAYWKIAGEEMKLSESWKPNYTNMNTLEMHYIYCTSNEISYGQAIHPTNKILIFPTRELRDTFLENFKDLIEKCKEFL